MLTRRCRLNGEVVYQHPLELAMALGREEYFFIPILFNLYVNDLSMQLRACNTGCMTGEMLVNHLMYADDLVILSPSSAGLQ